MKHLDLTLPTPEENLACDEALLDFCEEEYPHEILRFWESPKPFIVLGYADKAAAELLLGPCRKNGLPILRRRSGGGAVVQGAGCLNFCLILRITEGGLFRDIPATNAFVMKQHASVLQSHAGIPAQIQGFSDLTVGTLKFSGNAQRRKKRFLLFHGTFLLDFEIPLVETVLSLPGRQPDYRRNRRHMKFMTNLNSRADVIKAAIRQAWRATEPMTDIPYERIRQLAKTRYSDEAWTFKL
ncbi:MAG: hypothetical protein WD490_09730 [Opitutales bacterium]